MTFLEYINGLLRKEIAKAKNLAIFGQNIAAGSYLGGLTKGLKVGAGSRIINSTNAENSLVGLGFGAALTGANAIFFMRQIDFLLLTADQLVNTYNIIRNRKEPLRGSFTIFTTAIDQGYEGPQSSLNNFSDFASLARIPIYAVNNEYDAKQIIKSELVAPGFRIIAVSTRYMRQALQSPKQILYESSDLTTFQYEKGSDVTIVCFNFSYPLGVSLVTALGAKGLRASFFNVNAFVSVDWSKIITDIIRTKKLVVIDDSKSVNAPYFSLLAAVESVVPLKKKVIITRTLDSDWLVPNPDSLEINNARIIKKLL